MTYEVQFQHEGAEYKVIGPDIDGVLRLIQGVQRTDDKSDYERCQEAAVTTLRGMNYEWRGGEQWVPPIGPAPAALWYPDDSGEWVEGHPNTLPGKTVVSDFMYAFERENRNYTKPSTPCPAQNLRTVGSIVAYKVVKPCA